MQVRFASYVVVLVNGFVLRNRESICRRLRRRYSTAISKQLDSTVTPFKPFSALKNLRQKVDYLSGEFKDLTDGDATKFLFIIYWHYLASSQPPLSRFSIIEDALPPLQGLISTALHIQSEILQIDSIGQAWEESENLCKCMWQLAGCIEDMLCYALLGSGELVAAYDTGQLLCQVCEHLWFPIFDIISRLKSLF